MRPGGPLKAGLFNIRSMRNKLGFVIELLHEFDLDVLCLTETWLFPSDIDIIRAALPRSFSISHIPRMSGAGVGGGVAVIHSNVLDAKHEISNSQFSSFEFMEIRFACHGEAIHIYVIYRPGHPGMDRVFMEEFGSFFDSLLEVSGKILICGDFDYWVDDPSGKPYSREFLELVEINNFNNHVTFPTHLLGHTLDLVLSPTGTNFVKEVEALPIDSAVSDHALLTFTLEVARLRATKKSITFRSYKTVNQDLISSEIESCLVEAELPNLTAKHLTQHYNRSLTSLEEKHFPLITKDILVKPDSPWYDHTVAQLRRQRRKAERCWRRSRTESSRLDYVIKRRAVVDLVQQCKVQYYQNKWISCKGDPKKLNFLICSLMSSDVQASLPASSSDAQLASEFLEFFHAKIAGIREVLDGMQDQNSYLLLPLAQNPPLSVFSGFQPVSELNVRNYVKELNKTHCSLDPINISKITRAYDSAVPFIVLIINQCFAECTFVKSEKLALLRPLLKKTGLNVEEKNNYRPISNLTFLSKIIERAILDQLLPYLEQNERLAKYQSAYRELHSTETALCRIHNDLVANVCSGKASLLLLLDLSAAFDTIDHGLLLDDLFSFGVRGDALLLLRSYLQDRFQQVAVGQVLSEPKPLQFGVPQGSVLGPVLFILYTRSLADLLEVHGVCYHFYADDTQIYIEINNLTDAKDKILNLMHDIRVWMSRRKLKLNEGKTDILLIRGSLRSDLETEFGALDLGGFGLYPGTSAKNLGVVFDPRLNFTYHINSLVKNCNYHIRNLYAVKRYLSKDIINSLVHSLIVSRIDYCNSLFLGLPNYLLKKIQSIINKCARLIFSLPPRTPTTPYLIELHWLPVRARVEFKVCLIVYKALKFNKPRYIVDLLSRSTNTISVALSSSDDPYRLYEPRAVRESLFAERSFSYAAPRLYNKLPILVREQSSVQSFKTHLKTFLFSQAYDTADNVLSEAYRL